MNHGSVTLHLSAPGAVVNAQRAPARQQMGEQVEAAPVQMPDAPVRQGPPLQEWAIAAAPAQAFRHPQEVAPLPAADPDEAEPGAAQQPGNVPEERRQQNPVCCSQCCGFTLGLFNGAALTAALAASNPTLVLLGKVGLCLEGVLLACAAPDLCR